VELSLREQPVEQLKEIIAFLESHPLPPASGNSQSPRNLSISAYHDFINLLHGWLNEREQLLEKKDNRLHEITDSINHTAAVPAGEWSLDEISKTLFAMLDHERKGFFEEQKQLQSKLGDLLVRSPQGKLADSMDCFVDLADKYSGEISGSDVREKFSAVADLIDRHRSRNEILTQAAKAPPLFFVGLVKEKKIEELETDLFSFFSA
jgi:hypothetical protein